MVAEPAERLLVPRTVVPSRKVIVPEGAGRLVRVGATATERVTGWAATRVEGVRVGVNEVPPRFMKKAAPVKNEATMLWVLSARKFPAYGCAPNVRGYVMGGAYVPSELPSKTVNPESIAERPALSLPA